MFSMPGVAIKVDRAKIFPRFKAKEKNKTTAQKRVQTLIKKLFLVN